MLKYDTHIEPPQSPKTKPLPPDAFSGRNLTLVFVGVVVGGIASAFYFSNYHHETRLPSSGHSPLPQATFAQSSAPPSSPYYSGPAIQKPVAQSESQRAKDASNRSEQARLAREQLQREQAVTAERMRAEAAQREAAQRKAAGRDEIFELDTYVTIQVGSSLVSIKIHDNDVTSFDAWVNGAHYHEILKEKGITGSRTDETLIYSSGSAQLYYVWEISGKINHCRLRVRES